MKIHSQQKHRHRVEKRFFLVRTYFETHSFVEVSHIFRERFPGTEPPKKTTIFRKEKKYLDHDTSLNTCSKNVAGKLVGKREY